MNNSANDPVVLGFKDSYEFLGVSNTYLRNMIKDKRIPYQKTSNGVVFLKKHLVEFQNERIIKSKTDRRVQP